jgi:hypothetical protein
VSSRICFWMMIFLLCVGVARSQDAVTGALRGVVRDGAGAALVGARVSVARTPDGDELEPRVVFSDEQGSFYVPGLAPGVYAASVSAAKSAVMLAPWSGNVTVELGETLEIGVDLHFASLATSVTVQASVSEVEMQASPANATISPAEMLELPIDGRRWSSFALLTPLVNATDSSFVQVTAHGVAATQNRYVLDGMDDTQSFLGAPRGGVRANLIVPESAVQEFRVETMNASADLGKAAGGVVTTVTRRGSARRHGSAFFQTQDNALAATNPFAILTRYKHGGAASTYERPQDLRLQWGLTAEGRVPKVYWPMLRDKLFYFVAYEQQRRNFPALSSPSTTNFYTLSATQTALLQNRGVTLPKIDAALSYIDSLSGVAPRRVDEISFFPRLDWQQSARNQFRLAWNRARRTSTAGVRGDPVVHRGVTSFGNDRMHTDKETARWSYSPTSFLSNELSVSYSTDVETQTAQAPLPQEPQSGPNGYSPQVNIAGEFSLGKPASLGRRSFPDERRSQFSDTVSWAGGASLLQAGFDVSFIHEHIDTLANEEGSYNYSSGMTNGRAGGLADFITDYTFSATTYPNGACPSIFASAHFFCFNSYTQGFGHSIADFNTREWAAFVQHHWRPAKGITLDTGLRYDYVALPAAQHPNAELDAVFGGNPGLGASTSTLPSDTNNLQPRVGLAWNASRRTTLRAGFGVSFGSLPGATIRSALMNTARSSSSYTLRLGPKTTVDAACASAGTNFGYPATYACVPTGIAGKTTSAVMFSRRFQLPMVEEATFAVERDFGGTEISLAYAGAASRQLPNSTDINIAPSDGVASFRIVRPHGGGSIGARDGDTFSVPVYTSRVTTDFGPVTAVLSNASASYHALIAETVHRLQRGVQFRASWTYAKMLDYGQNHSATPQQNAQFDPFDVRYDRAASTLDRRHKISASGLWEPVFHLNRTEGLLGNGWVLATSFSAVSGRPYSYEILGGTELDGGRESINGAGGARYLPTVGRNTQRLPWVEVLDLRLSRRFRIAERMHARLYADAFNLLNHVNYTGVQQRAFLVSTPVNGVTPLVFQDAATIASEGLQSRAFGSFDSANAANARERRVQFGLRAEW